MKNDILVDIVFVSNSISLSAQLVTQNAINTSINCAGDIAVNCIVVESNKKVSYKNVITVHPTQSFNYNAYLNLGASYGGSKYIMFCNNDLVFTKDYLKNLIEQNYPIVSPICPKDIRQKNIKINEKGYVCGRHLSGWAFLIERNLWQKIGKLDEDFDFWFADNSLISQLKMINTPPMVVPSSVVKHIGSMTLNKMTLPKKQELMWSKLELYNKKYKESLFENNVNYIKWKQSQLQ